MAHRHVWPMRSIATQCHGPSMRKMAEVVATDARSNMVPAVRCMSTGKKSLRGKSNASARWVRRQWNDPMVKQAKREGLRSRAAIKLREINTKFQLLKRGDIVLDLGAAPGGWTQIAVEATAPKRKPKDSQPVRPNVIALDLKAFDPIDGSAQIIGDFRQPAVREQIDAFLGGRKADVVLSDMAPSFAGNFLVDSQAQLRLCANALKMAELYLRPGGHFATKILRCDGSEDFREDLKARFGSVKGMKPLSSRPESTEMFLVAKDFKASPAPTSSDKQSSSRSDPAEANA